MKQDKFLVTNQDLYDCVTYPAGDLLADPESRSWKNKTTIPQNGTCVSVADAKSLVYLDESTLPTDGTMPTWDELNPIVPCGGTVKLSSSLGLDPTAVWEMGNSAGTITVSMVKTSPMSGCEGRWVKIGFYQGTTLLGAYTYNCDQASGNYAFTYSPSGGRVTSKIIDRYNVHLLGIDMDMTLSCPQPTQDMITVNLRVIPYNGDVGYRINAYLLDYQGNPINNPCSYQLDITIPFNNTSTIVHIPSGSSGTNTDTQTNGIYSIGSPTWFQQPGCSYDFIGGSVSGDTYELKGVLKGSGSNKKIEFTFSQGSTLRMNPCNDVTITYSTNGSTYTQVFPFGAKSVETTQTFSSISNSSIDSAVSSGGCINTITLGNITQGADTYYVWLKRVGSDLVAEPRDEPNGGGSILPFPCDVDISATCEDSITHQIFIVQITLPAMSFSANKQTSSGAFTVSSAFTVDDDCLGTPVVLQHA